MTKQKAFQKNLKKKTITTHFDAGGNRGCHAPSFFIFAKPAIQKPNIQPGEF